MGKGGSNSASTNTTNTTLTATTTTIFNTEALANALINKTKADLALGKKGLALDKADLLIKSAKAKADLSQKQHFFNDIEGGLKKYALLGGFSYIGYKILKKKR